MKNYKFLANLFKVSVIFLLFACTNNKSKTEQKNRLMSKPYIDHKISFSIYDKEISTSFVKFKDIPTDRLLKIIDSMIVSLEHREPSYDNVYFSWYDTYNQPLDFKVYFSSRKTDAKNNLASLKNNLLKNNRNTDFSVVQQMYIYYKYGNIFKGDWFLQPDIAFSAAFYDQVLSGQSKEVLINSYQYDGHDSNNYLQRFKTLATDDKFVIQPHYIDKLNAKLLYNSVKIPLNDSILTKEAQAFKILLDKVAKEEIELVVNYDDL